MPTDAETCSSADSYLLIIVVLNFVEFSLLGRQSGVQTDVNNNSILFFMRIGMNFAQKWAPVDGSRGIIFSLSVI